MKKVSKRDERRRSTAARKNSSSKIQNNQPSSSTHGSAPRRLKNKLYICGLLPTVLREELIREFGKFGKLHDVWVAKKPPGFAFVEYINSRDAERVVHELDDTKVLGSKVRIEFAKANKGPEEIKKPKKLSQLGSAGSSGSKMLPGKPAIAPLMGQLIVPSLLTASLAPSLSLLGSPPLSGLPLAAQGMTGPTYKRARSPRDGKRYRGDSGGRWEQGPGRKAISPLMRRFSRSPEGRGRMLSPPPKRSMMPTSPFSRLSRSQRSIPSLLPPPPSRDIDASPSKLMRMPGATATTLRRFSRSPLRTGSLRRMRRSLSRTHARSPGRSWARVSPARSKRAVAGRPQRSVSPSRKRSPPPRRKGSLSRGRERSASLRRNFVKSQVNTVKRSKKTSGSRSAASSPYDGKDLPRDDHSGFKGPSKKVPASPGRRPKRYGARSNSSGSGSATRSPETCRRLPEVDVKRSRTSSKSSLDSEYGARGRGRPVRTREVGSFGRRSSRSSDRRNSTSLRRHFYGSPAGRYSRDRSPPLNFVRTRLLGRTPPSPPARNSKTPDRGAEDARRRGSASNSPAGSDDERRSRSGSYESPAGSRRGSAARSGGRESFESAAGGVRSNPRVGARRSASTSSRSTASSSRAARRGSKNFEPLPKSPAEVANSRVAAADNRANAPRHAKANNRKSSAASDRAGQRKRSRSADSGSTARKRACLRTKGGPRSPSGSPDLNPTKYARVQLPREASHQKRSSSSKSKNSNPPSDRSRNASTGRKTPLAYQCPRESMSPPASQQQPSSAARQKKEFRHRSKSPAGRKGDRRANSRGHAKAKSDRRNREASRRGAAAAGQSADADRYGKKESRHSPYHSQDRHRVRYYKSPPPPPSPLTPPPHGAHAPQGVDHRHYRMLEVEEMAARMERSRAAAAYYDDHHHHHADPRAQGSYYRRSDYPGEPDKGYYRRPPSPPSHLPPPPPLPSYPYRRMPEVQYQRSGARARCDEVDPFYRNSDPYRGRAANPSPAVVYRESGANPPSYPRQRPYRR